MATTAELIEKLQFLASVPVKGSVAVICGMAAERLETLYNERMAAADELDRVEAKYKALLEKAIADIPHYCGKCAHFIENGIENGTSCALDYKCAWKWRGEE